MARGHGKWDDLTLQVRAATTNNPYIEEKKAAYWNTRKANQLEDFDAWVLDAQEKLDALKKQGYDTATAQRTHDVIVSKRPDLVTALDSKNDESDHLRKPGDPSALTALGQQVGDVQVRYRMVKNSSFISTRGYRAVSRADAISIIDLTANPARYRSCRTCAEKSES